MISLLNKKDLNGKKELFIKEIEKERKKKYKQSVKEGKLKERKEKKENEEGRIDD